MRFLLLAAELRPALRLLPIALMLVAGCGISLAPPPPRHMPADPIDLSFYMRNTTDDPHYFIVLSENQPLIEGPVQRRPASTGCGAVGRDWELTVSQTPSRPDPGGEMAHRVTGEAFGDPDVLALWLSVEPDGTVVTGDGVPEWWVDDL